MPDDTRSHYRAAGIARKGPGDLAEPGGTRFQHSLTVYNAPECRPSGMLIPRYHQPFQSMETVR
jgi:hypothetical protein